MENRVRDAEKDVEAVLRKRRMEEEKLVRDLYDAYLAEHRDALRHNSRLLKDELRAAQQKERQKREAEEHYRRDQLRMLEEELAGIKKEETIVVKAQAEEMRKVLREQKESARLNLMRVREKLRVDERDFDLKAIAAERIRGKLAFKPVPTGTTFGKNPKGRRR
ncbi:hypothetical protein BC829DRAFT_392698 [Chytridium lagenaria]|nr:hypothetical protein BC829DRAFT_392698 [Chytridium lagenaria]